MSSTPPSNPTGITVFCGASPGNSPVYTAAARSVAQALVREGIEVQYGGGTKGVMGVVREAALEAGGKVHGIIPAAFLSAEAPERPAKANPNETETIVDSMHARKKLMADLSQAFIGLPGGYGTLEEVAEMTTWSQIGVHLKPVVLLNVNGFYSPLRDFFENAITSGFIPAHNRAFLTFVDGPPLSPSPSSSSHEQEQESFDWGAAALAAIRAWQAQGSGGATPFSFEWSGDRKRGEEVL
ncbi:hypothetical protein JCM6882_007439 [Rhodosporidiobolus microsporus]